MGVGDKTRQAAGQARDLIRERNGWVSAAGRVGLASVGLSFAIVGLIAFTVALRGGGEMKDRQGALSYLSGDPIGKILLVALAAGFAGYAFWRLVIAATGESVENGDGKNPVKRVLYLLRGSFYAGLSVGTASLVFTGPRSGSQGEESQEVALLLHLPGGRWIVIGAGIVVGAVAVWNLWRAMSGNFKDELKTHEMDEREKNALSAISRYGLSARGLVFLMISIFLVRAAVTYDPREAVGLDGALARLASTSHGPWLLGLAGLGLISYGAFRLVEARYRVL